MNRVLYGTTFFNTWQKLLFQKMCRCCLHSFCRLYNWKVAGAAVTAGSALILRFISKIGGKVLHVASLALHIVLNVAQFLLFLFTDKIIGGEVQLTQAGNGSVGTVF